MPQPDFLTPTDLFPQRHIGPTDADIGDMLTVAGMPSLEHLCDVTVPQDIQLKKPLDLPVARGEQAVLRELNEIAGRNRIYRSLIGMGYYHCITPGVIQRNILENPGWYTHPPGTVAYEYQGDLQEPRRQTSTPDPKHGHATTPQPAIEVQVQKPKGSHNH